ncbi:MAG: 23S rRNA (pseudouridine(1915)-N(3))-methyltransferase RlmH [Xanthobacteraceae bacterium]|nr:23S rRNA (pseudouridine(1915)-N(3))-methyltransferase RlmH [Xanthobacteraceae bacterium]QYK44845.1 MAG: 23S rRNA (pseudouridine(1915)-N(3))-methyltransferase RlmH [Xanthobacteraceae bacterium]HMN51474.1 23S rRNA (pseudouridine(1915)-N(3))-methyltransferase RlmH [Xanthobacteraceae bacterium]
MRLLIAAVGRLKAGPERELLARYVERTNATGKALSLAPLEIAEIPESPAQTAMKRKSDEAKALLAALPAKAKIIALDERGKSISSEDFAKKLARLRDDGAGSVAFLLGGADGLDDTVRKKADLTVAYGAATFPHQIVRILLAEQIYRAVTILSGHPYHRGD